MGYGGLGISWPVDSRKESPRLVALITEDYLELVDYDTLLPSFQDFVVEEARRGAPPRISLGCDDDTPDDPH